MYTAGRERGRVCGVHSERRRADNARHAYKGYTWSAIIVAAILEKLYLYRSPSFCFKWRKKTFDKERARIGRKKRLGGEKK